MSVTQLPLQGIRIAKVATVPFFVATQLLAQIEGLISAGAEVTVICSDGPMLEKIRGIANVRVIVIALERNINPLGDAVSLFRLISTFRRENFHIIHSTTPKAGLLVAFAGLASSTSVRLHTFTGQRWANMSGIKRFLFKKLDGLIGKLNNKSYADSVSQMQYLVDEGVVDGKKISVIGEGSLAGVDLARFSQSRMEAPFDVDSLRRKYRLGATDRIVLFLGRVSIDKGIREFIEGVRLVKHSGVRALVVGPLEAKFSDLFDTPDEKIVWVGPTDYPEAFFAIADILCVPSYREGFGTVVIEAAAMGVPAVVTNIYGFTDAVKQGETGILVPVRNAEAVGSALNMLLWDDALLSRLGCNARKRAQSLFGNEAVTAAYILEYTRLLLSYR